MVLILIFGFKPENLRDVRKIRPQFKIERHGLRVECRARNQTDRPGRYEASPAGGRGRRTLAMRQFEAVWLFKEL